MLDGKWLHVDTEQRKTIKTGGKQAGSTQNIQQKKKNNLTNSLIEKKKKMGKNVLQEAGKPLPISVFSSSTSCFSPACVV